MPDNNAKYRRKKHFIQKMFQLKFIILFLLLLILGSIISGMILYMGANRNLGYEYSRAHIKIDETGDILRPAIFVSYGISIIIIGIATVLLTLYISHKVAGPLYRFEKSADEIGRGNLTLITRIRGSDQAKGLADAFSRMTMELRKKVQDIDGCTLELNKIIEDLNNALEQKKPDFNEVKIKAKELEGRSQDLRKYLQYFKL